MAITEPRVCPHGVMTSGMPCELCSGPSFGLWVQSAPANPPASIDIREHARQALLRIGELCGVDYPEDATLAYLADAVPVTVTESQKSHHLYQRLYRELAGQESVKPRRAINRWRR